ncbi:hypothetical protein [Campylobacter volucris]|nr:hypothetical protein [Campylobacter volucris]
MDNSIYELGEVCTSTPKKPAISRFVIFKFFFVKINIFEHT